MAPLKIFSRVATCAGEAADSSVWQSSIRTRLGRTVAPSGLVCFTPRMRPVMPATRTAAPADGAPGIQGSVIWSAVQSSDVDTPPQVWPRARAEIPSRARIG